MSIFTSSPPCVSHQMEVSCLGCLVTLPQHLAPKSLQTLSAFISHRPNLSLSVIPITFSIIRKFISGSSPDLPTLQALQKVLGLFSRHKADYSPVLPFLLADLLTLLQSLPFDKRGILTTSLYPLLDMLEKHSFSYLSSNLSPSTNELFKAILETYNSSHKFKGKVWLNTIVVIFKFESQSIYQCLWYYYFRSKRSKCHVDPRSIWSVWPLPSPGCWTNLVEPSPSSPDPDPTSSPPLCPSLCSSGNLGSQFWNFVWMMNCCPAVSSFFAVKLKSTVLPDHRCLILDFHSFVLF